MSSSTRIRPALYDLWTRQPRAPVWQAQLGDASVWQKIDGLSSLNSAPFLQGREGMYDSSTSIRQFVSATAAKQPTPGGGSVTALVGALAAATGEMVVNYSIGKKELEAFQDELRPAMEELARAREALLQLMVEDQLAYQAYSDARKLPEGTAEQSRKLAAATLATIRVPESIAATALALLDRYDRLVNFVNFRLLSDLAVAADLAMATIRCAIYNVRVNLKQVTDPGDRQAIESRIGQVLNRAVLLIQSVAPRIWDRESQG